MELKATSLGKRLAQHPYDKVVLLNAGVKVSGERHEYLIPFNQLLAIHCKRGLVWGELEFVLPEEKVVRLHGTEWAETQRFHHHLNTLWQQWSAEMSEVAAQVLQNALNDITTSNEQNSWLTREKTLGLQQKLIRRCRRCRCRSRGWTSLITVGKPGASVGPGWRILTRAGWRTTRRGPPPCSASMPIFLPV